VKDKTDEMLLAEHSVWKTMARLGLLDKLLNFFWFEDGK
jgi:hypothetical protein